MIKITEHECSKTLQTRQPPTRKLSVKQECQYKRSSQRRSLKKETSTLGEIVSINFIEFWSTAVAFDPFPSTNEPEKRPLKEFIIKFLVSNRQRHLTLDFQTFCSSTDLNYNKGKYVEHPTPEVVKKELGKIAINPSYLDKTPVLKNSFPMAWRILFTFVIQVLGGNYSSTEQVNFIHQLLAYNLVIGTEVDIKEIIYSDLGLSVSTSFGCKAKKGKSQTVTSTSPRSQVPEASGALSKKSKIPKSKKPPTKTKTQSSRLRYQSLTRNEGEPSYKGEPKTQPMILSYVDVRAILLSEDEAQEINDDLATNKKIEEAFETLAKISTQTTEILSSVMSFDFSTLLSNVKNIQDHAFKQEEALATWMKSSTNMAWNLGSRISGLDRAQSHIKSSMSSLQEDTSSIKSMMTEMYNAFRGQSSSVPSITQPITIIHPEPSISQIKGKGIATDDHADDLRKLVKASSIIRLDPDEPDKEEEIKKAKEEARLNAISKTKVIKVVREEAEKLGIHPKEAITSKAGELFKKAQDAEHKILKRQHTKKVRKSLELRKHKYDSYMLTVSSRLKPEPITDIKIHPKTKLVVITVYRGTDGRNFDTHKPFLFGAFGISELDELREIIPKKKNTVVKDLMNSLSQRYERLRQIPKELGIQSALPAPKHPPSQTSGRKQKHMELEPETRIPGLECNRTLPENVPFVNNMVIEEPEYGIFFTDEFGDQAFQRWSDIEKVGMKALVSYLLAGSMVKSPENARFSMKLRKLIAEHPDQEKLKSKKLKLEALGYKID
nr:hypothetical protein [Tanacetum cinerariifolium]